MNYINIANRIVKCCDEHNFDQAANEIALLFADRSPDSEALKDDIYSYFFDALATAAIDDVNGNDLQSLLSHYNILMSTDQRDQATEQQMLSNIAQLYGRKGEYVKAKEAIDRLRKFAQGGDEEATSGLADAIYNLISQCAKDDVVRYRRQIKAMADDLEALAHQTDGTHEHTRYVMALYNIVGQLEANDIPHAAMWDLLYNYSMAHTINSEMADNIAMEEMTLASSVVSLQEALMHRGRVKNMAEHLAYGQYMTERLAATEYNLMLLAVAQEELSLAEELLRNLMGMADEHAYDYDMLKQIVLRIAKGSIVLATKYAKMNAVDKAEKLYDVVSAQLIAFAGDDEISQRLTKMALNLCIDLQDAGRDKQARKIYNELQNLMPQFNEECHERMKKMGTLF